jgi:arylsulfatase A-like enzyme
MKKISWIPMVFLLTTASEMAAQQVSKPNILFIAIDDLKPILGCYGNTLIKTPNIDRLAKMGTVFMSNYCQQAVCGPTRASLMTGKRPDYTRIWDLKTKMRDMNPDILSLPQYLITQGYSTQGIGKVYDPRCVDKENDKPSWSVQYYKTNKKYYPAQTGEPALERYQLTETKLLVAKYIKEALDSGKTISEANEYAQTKIKPSVENADVPDNAYNDGANILQAKNILTQLSKSNQPFFFAVGIAKPHLPFVAPKKYWDLYNRADMPLAKFQEKSINAVDFAYHNAGEIRAYTDIPPLLSFTDQKSFGLTLPVNKQKELIHGYYAAISYADALVGDLLTTLQALGLTKNTIIILWGDHGWHLGDHNLWCKHSNFEEATHSPLIISAPGMAASKTYSLTEFVDVFPTLCELAGVKIPMELDGKSLMPLMKNASATVKEFAMSQYPRNRDEMDTGKKGNAETGVMGYSLRDKQYRYTIWMDKGFRSTRPYKKNQVVGIELYDYKTDPLETVNVANDSRYSVIAQNMHAAILAFFKSQAR